MKKNLFIIFLFASVVATAQTDYTTNHNGTVFNASGQKLTPTEVRALLANQTDLLERYNVGRTKKQQEIFCFMEV